jgi:hypothetical protein
MNLASASPKRENGNVGEHHEISLLPELVNSPHLLQLEPTAEETDTEDTEDAGTPMKPRPYSSPQTMPQHRARAVSRKRLP